MKLPNLIIIGAAKCGTSALYHYLANHPEASMSVPKEPRFFTEHWERGTEWYASCFADADTPIIGEASPQYTIAPRHGDIPARMHSVVPDAKLVYLVRDPIERIASAYVDRISHGRREPPFDEAIRTNADYINQSRYAMQLEQYLPYYPLERILVIDQADLLAHRRETLLRVFRFVGIDETVDSPRFEDIRNASAEKRRMRRAPFLPRDIAPRPVGRLPWMLRKRFRRVIFRPMSVSVPRPQLTAGQREALSDVLAPEADRLRALTGQAFATWSL